jgi:hypothetical protein
LAGDRAVFDENVSVDNRYSSNSIQNIIVGRMSTCMERQRSRKEVVYSDDDEDGLNSSDDEEEGGAGLYLQAKSLALMELDVQSRLYTYEQNNAEVIDHFKDIPPHIKSYSRLMMPVPVPQPGPGPQSEPGPQPGSIPQPEPGPQYKPVPQPRQAKCNCYALAWTLITSSCLSRGAHGKEVPHSLCTDCHHVRRGYTEILNFEIGVMFHSRPGKQYKALNPQCPLHSASPHSASPHSASPHSASPHSASPHSASPHSASPHSASPHSASPHSASPHSASPHSASPHNALPHSASPLHNASPHSASAVHSGDVGPLNEDAVILPFPYDLYGGINVFICVFLYIRIHI